MQCFSPSPLIFTFGSSRKFHLAHHISDEDYLSVFSCLVSDSSSMMFLKVILAFGIRAPRVKGLVLKSV